MAGDCFTRSVTVATGLPYAEIGALLTEEATRERRGKRSSVKGGVYIETAKRVMLRLGWTWKPTMSIGAGCTVHLRPDELPAAMIVVRLSRHFAGVRDGAVISDGHNAGTDRDGTRCVYGYWIKS